MGKVYIIRGKLSRSIDYCGHSENLYAVNISTFTVLPYSVNATITVNSVVYFSLLFFRAQTALHKAAWYGYRGICKILVEANASLLRTDYQVNPY